MRSRRDRIYHEYDGRMMGPKLMLELNDVPQRRWHRRLSEAGEERKKGLLERKERELVEREAAEQE